MSKYFITIDTGTTNTRAFLWDADNRCAASRKSPVGVRVTAIDGHNGRLKEAVKECLEGLLADAGCTYGEVRAVVAAGMITSNVGLVEIPHLTAPAGKRELAAGMRRVELPEICPLPIWFIPGVRNSGAAVTLENMEGMDIMRGEEVETIAIVERLHTGSPMVLALPGSHTKFVAVDAAGAITGCLTTITGELLSSITNDTIIADAVGRQYVEEDTYDRELMLEGCRAAAKVGLGRACFSGRILNLFAIPDKAKIANFIFGAVLQSDVDAILHSSAIQAGGDTVLVVAGKNPFRCALADIFTHEKAFGKVQEYTPAPGEMSMSAQGAYHIAAERGIL